VTNGFLVQGVGSPGAILRCTGPDACAPLGLPAGEPEVLIVTDDLG
jgi:hypothetical protein